MSALLPWQQPVWDELVKRQQQQGLPHALMFTGIAGIGKHQLSRSVAQWLLCTEAETNDSPVACGQCHSCQLWQAGSHPDFMLCQPQDNSRQIRIDSIRQVNDFLAQTPQISRCQLVIIRPVEVMNTNAANALLKTLEEPAGESFLLLEAERFGSVLPTIRSRCQRLQLQPPDAAQALAWLQQQGIATDQAQLALRFNPGAPLRARTWLEQQLGQQQQQWLEQFRQWSMALMPLETLVAGWNKLEITDVISWLDLVLSDALKVSLGVDEQQLRYGSLLPQALAGATLDQSKLITLQRKVMEVQGNLFSGVSHYNKQLLIESLMLDWRQALIPSKTQAQ